MTGMISALTANDVTLISAFLGLIGAMGAALIYSMRTNRATGRAITDAAQKAEERASIVEERTRTNGDAPIGRRIERVEDMVLDILRDFGDIKADLMRVSSMLAKLESSMHRRNNHE